MGGTTRTLGNVALGGGAGRWYDREKYVQYGLANMA